MTPGMWLLFACGLFNGIGWFLCNEFWARRCKRMNAEWYELHKQHTVDWVSTMNTLLGLPRSSGVSKPREVPRA